MLPAANRLRHSAQFSAAVRSGRRCGGRAVVVHHLASGDADVVGDASGAAPLVGFVVSKSVGGSVVRHRVSRRLRAVMAGHLVELAPGSSTVIRALPSSATASSAELDADLSRAFGRLAGRR